MNVEACAVKADVTLPIELVTHIFQDYFAFRTVEICERRGVTSK